MKVRCIKHLAHNKKWILKSGSIYEARIKENEIEIINHYGEIVTLNLRDFNHYCIVI